MIDNSNKCLFYTISSLSDYSLLSQANEITAQTKTHMENTPPKQLTSKAKHWTIIIIKIEKSSILHMIGCKADLVEMV